MHISWLGLSAFKIETSGAVIVTDPYAPSVMDRPLRAKADIVTVSNPGSVAHNHVGGVSGDPFVVDHPGEYEVRGVFLQGMESPGKAAPAKPSKISSKADAPASWGTTLYTLDSEDLRLAHLGDVQGVPSNETLERLGDVDVLFLPVGGGPTLDPEAAMRVVNAIEPLVVIPMHFEQRGLRLPGKLLPSSAFLREIGSSKVEPVERLSVKRRDLVAEETRVVLLSA